MAGQATALSEAPSEVYQAVSSPPKPLLPDWDADANTILGLYVRANCDLGPYTRANFGHLCHVVRVPCFGRRLGAGRGGAGDGAPAVDDRVEGEAAPEGPSFVGEDPAGHPLADACRRAFFEVPRQQAVVDAVDDEAVGRKQAQPRLQ